MSQVIKHQQAAFTLIELLIVIVLASVMAWLVATLFSNRGGVENVSIPRLKERLIQRGLGSGELICIDRCSRCFLQDKRGRVQEINLRLPPLKVYLLDGYGEAYRLEFGRYMDRAICLRFRIDADGHSSRLIIESKGKYYYLPSYFGDVEHFDSLKEAQDRWRQDYDLLRSREDYY